MLEGGLICHTQRPIHAVRRREREEPALGATAVTGD